MNWNWKNILATLVALLILYYIWKKLKHGNSCKSTLFVEQKACEMHGPAFLKKAKSIEKELGMPTGTLCSIMYSESGLKHNVFNSIGAGGLIGFLPSTLKGQGYQPADLKSMSAIKQLDLVKTFYQKWLESGIKPASAEEFYLLTFYPYAVGKPDSYELGSHNNTAQTVYAANSPLDWNKDGHLTVGDFKAYLKNQKRLAGTIFQK